MIIQFDLEGRLVRTYTNLKEVSKTYRNISVRTNDVKRTLEGMFKQTGGYQWKQVEVNNLVKK